MKKTYGSKLIDHIAKNHTLDDDVIEYRRKLECDVLKEIENVIAKTRNAPLYRFKDFYIVMLTKVERLGGVPHNMIFARRSCPTPIYRQSVWKFKNVADQLEFLWAIPDSILYNHILRNKEKYLADKECAELAKFVILMESGELLEWVKRENCEKIDAVINIKKESPCLTN
jgi:hypothetical protein